MGELDVRRGGGTLPEGGIAPKDHYLIGMSQANKGEPWRQAMNDQIAAAAESHPELEVVFADAAQDNVEIPAFLRRQAN